MATIFFKLLLAVAVLVILYMAHKNYENIDINYWTIVVLIPIVILGYWLKTTVTTTEGAMVCFAIIYLDSTVMLIVMLFSMLRFLRIEVKAWVKTLAYTITFGHVYMFWECIHNDWYYTSMTLIDTGNGIATKMTGGPLKIVHWIYLAIVLCAIVVTLIYALVRRGTYSRRTLLLYACVTVTGLVMYGLESTLDVNFSSLPILYVVADVLIAVNYDHAHTHDIACLISEQQKYHGSRGYVAIDMEGRFLSCNLKSYEFLPEAEFQIVDAKLQKGSKMAAVLYDLMDAYRKDGTKKKDFYVGEMACRCEITEFTIRKDGKMQGFLFDIRDITEEKKVLSVMQDYNDTLNEEVLKKTENIKGIQERVVLGLANMVENRDANTGGHVKRTSDIIKIIVDEMEKQEIYNLSEQMAEDIVRAAPMHDLGKITIENNILNKPARLTKEEFEIMKTHSAKSGEFVNIILKDVEEKHFVDVAFNVARYHHERWDGKGYPEGLVGEMIPLEARIMAIADVYDALVSKRCYKEAMSFEKAAEIMTDGMGSQFDPNMLTVFLGCREQLEKYYSEN
ncbi:MAG: HD domain-containing protein [Lachnospiraceae bacterium]|nr:HD domain-containing protein [Lachnospiraceae bacterium]